jgi:uncharacterized protein YfbU (UPF0304 family)
MNISDGEKLILLMLSDLYQKLELDGEIDPDFIKSALFNDQMWGISWKYTGIPFANDETPPEVSFVVDVLDMWDFIELSVERLSKEDREVLAEQADPFGRNPSFNGFDGNNEGREMSIARFLINDLERFQRFSGRDLNCHHPSLDMHMRMLEAFKPIRERTPGTPLGVESLVQILSEQTNPDNR